MRHTKIAIAAYTGYGKTLALAIAELLSAVLNQGIRIGHISRSQKQTSICYDYILSFLSRNQLLYDILPQGKRTPQELSKTMSREKISIGDSLITILTANLNKKGTNLLGWHFDIVIEDESAEIPDYIENVMIGRMLEVGPNDKFIKIHVKISTTHQRGHFKEWIDNRIELNIKVIIIDDVKGISEGRVKIEFLEDRKRALGPELYGIWYQCKFPEQDSDAVFSEADVNFLLREVQFDGWIGGEFRVISCDPARFGKDKSVISLITLASGIYHCKKLKGYSKQDTKMIGGECIRYIREYSAHYFVNDDIGLGGGITDEVRNYRKFSEETVFKNLKIIAFKAGDEPLTEDGKKYYHNASSEAYYFLQRLIRERIIHYVENPFIRQELLQIKYEYDTKNRLHVAKKSKTSEIEEKSPDNLDSLIMGLSAFIGGLKQGRGYAIARF